jgi:hypothetical protein
MSAHDQMVIVYDDADGRTRAYSTAYDPNEEKRQTARCRYRHGIHANVRAVNWRDAKRMCAREAT